MHSVFLVKSGVTSAPWLVGAPPLLALPRRPRFDGDPRVARWWPPSPVARASLATRAAACARRRAGLLLLRLRPDSRRPCSASAATTGGPCYVFASTTGSGPCSAYEATCRHIARHGGSCRCVDMGIHGRRWALL
jgi:hypothetical protein